MGGMKTLILLMCSLLTFSSFAQTTPTPQELAVTVEGDRNETQVVLTPLEKAPEGIPIKKSSSDKVPPRWWKLTLVGIGLAPIEFFISTALHEGAHAVTAAANGAEITGYHPYPHKEEGMPWRLGDVHWKGTMTPGQRALTLAAPMILDTAVLGTYGALVLSNSLPENRYAKLAMFVFAAGHWVDIANHMIARNEHTDTQRLERYFQNEHNLSVTQSRLAVRGSQALVLAAGGFFLYKGFRQIFKGTADARPNLNLTAEQALAFDKKEAEKRRKEKNKKFFSRHDIYLTPNVSSDGGGFMFGGTF